MSHRERVLCAFNHQEADRIPIDLMGNASMMLDETYLRLRDFLGFDPIPPVRSGSTANYYDERILEHFDIDFRRLFLKKAASNTVTVHADDSFTDLWGVTYQRSGPFVNVVRSPLENATTVRDIDRHDWPSAEALFSTAGLAAEARLKFEQTDYALVARNPTNGGFLEHGCNMMGMPNFLMSLIGAPDVAHAVIRRILDIYLEVYGMFLDAAGPYVQMVEVSDDLGSNDNLLISPSMYRQFFKPAEQELYALIMARAPGAQIFHHTDGAVFEIIPDLHEVGVRVLNPVQTSVVGMEGENLKKSYGKLMTFHGAVELMEGDIAKDVVIEHVKDRIDKLAKGGGYVLAPCNHMIDVKPENIIAIYETAREYGMYH